MELWEVSVTVLSPRRGTVKAEVKSSEAEVLDLCRNYPARYLGLKISVAKMESEGVQCTDPLFCVIDISPGGD